MKDFDKEFKMQRCLFYIMFVVVFVFIVANMAMDTFVKFKVIQTGVEIAEDPKGNAKQLGRIVKEFKKGMEETDED